MVVVRVAEGDVGVGGDGDGIGKADVDGLVGGGAVSAEPPAGLWGIAISKPAPIR